MDKVTNENRAEKAQEVILDEIIYNSDNHTVEELKILADAAKSLEDSKQEEVEEPTKFGKFMEIAGKICENPLVQLGGKVVGGLIVLTAVNDFERDDSYSGSRVGVVRDIVSKFFR